MTYQAPDEGAASESFSALTPVSTDVPAGRLYEMLAEALRQDDQNSSLGGSALLERMLLRFEELRDRIAQKPWRLLYAKHYDLTPDELVEHLLENVGFGPGSGVAYEVASALSLSLKRRLVKAAIPFWKKRGTFVGLEDSIKFVSGLRPIIDTWFDFRMVDGVSALGYYLPTPASISSILLTLEVGSDPSSMDGGEYESRIFITSNGDTNGLDELIYDLCSLARPCGEYMEIHYGLYGDRFLDGRLSYWKTLEGTSSAWVPPNSGPNKASIPVRLPGLRYVVGTTRETVEYESPYTLTDYEIRAWIRPGTGNQRIITFYAMSSASATRASGVGASINWVDKTVQAVSKTAADLNDTPGLQTATLAISDAEEATWSVYSLFVQVKIVDATYAAVRVYFDSELVIDETIEHFGQTEGPIEVYSFESDSHWDLCRIEVESLDSVIRRIYPPIYAGGVAP